MPSGDYIILTKAAVIAESSVSAVKLYPVEYSCNMYRMIYAHYIEKKHIAKHTHIKYEVKICML